MYRSILRLLQRIKVLCALVCMLFAIISTEPAYALSGEDAAQAGFDVFEAWKIINCSEYSYMVNEYESPAQKTVDEIDSPLWQSMLFAWRVATFNLSSEVSYATKEIGYYDTILMNILYDEKTESLLATHISFTNDMLDEAEKTFKMTNASVGKKLTKAGVNLNGVISGNDIVFSDGSSLTVSDYINKIMNIPELNETVSILGDVAKYLEYCTDIADAVEKFSKIQVLQQSQQEISDVLMDMLGSINSTTPEQVILRESLVKYQQIVSDSIPESAILAIFAGEKSLKVLLDELSGSLWQESLNLLTSGYGAIVSAGQAVGKLSADTLFNTSGLVGAWYEMNTVVSYEEAFLKETKDAQSAFESNPTPSNARKFTASYKLLMKAYLEGIEVTGKYLDASYQDGSIHDVFRAVGKLCPWADNYTYLQEYKDALSRLSTQLKRILQYMDTRASNAYLDYVEVIEREEVTQVYLDLSPIPEVNYNESDFAHFEDSVFLLSNPRISKNMTLTQDLHTIGNLVLTGGTLDLNGHELIIDGNMQHTGGVMNVNKGKVNISGNYYIVGEATEDGEEDIPMSKGSLQMQNETDEVRVGGDFIMKSEVNHNSSMLKAGTIYVAGDFTEKQGYYYYTGYSSGRIEVCNYKPGEGHQTVLNGTGQQVISFEDSECGFGTLIATNEQLMLEENINWIALGSDIQAISRDVNINVNEINLNGRKLTITGDVQLGTDVDISNGTMTIDGSLYHSSGILDVNGGKVSISQNYHAYDGDAIIKMETPSDEVIVHGNFISEGNNSHILEDGILYIAGNISVYNFCANERHKTVLNGKEIQSVCFEKNNSHFGTLIAENQRLTFEKSISWITMGSDIQAFSRNVNLNGQEMCLNGKTLTITGDIVLNTSINVDKGNMIVNGSVTHTGGVINVNKGKVNISGNYYIVGEATEDGEEDIPMSKGSLQMQNETDEVRVGGDFIMKSEVNHNSSMLKAGTIYVAGDFAEKQGYYYYYTGYSSGRIEVCNYKPGEGHKTVLNGIGQQIISFEDSECGFGTLELTNSMTAYTFNPNPCWITLLQVSLGTPDLTLPASVKEVSESAFEGIAAETVYVPDGCVKISAYAFRNSAVVKIRIPEKCTVADTAFEGCENVTIFGINGSAADMYCKTHSNCKFIAE